MFDVLRATEDWVVVDSGPGFTPEVIAAIDAATDICMVGTVDAAALKNTKLGLETLELMGVDPERGEARPEPRRQSRRHHARRTRARHRPPTRTCSSRATATSPRSANEGRPIVMSQPGSEPARALRGLAESYMGVGEHARRRPLKRLLGRGG